MQAQTIGPYRIVETLGRGGMGVVYRAEHLQTAEPVALKTVLVPREGVLQSIRREIHALARIQHPGVVRVMDEGIEEGLPWYAMELLEGMTLRQWCQELARQRPPQDMDTASEAQPRREQGRVTATGWVGVGPAASGQQAARRSSPEPAATLRERAAGGALPAALSLVRRLCGPLAYIHGEGIVHRDLKPENILVRADGTPVLVDFGLVSRFAGELSREALEVGGAASGTVAYMAPEQGRGDFVDARADLYALGCILYELVAGRRPFVGETPVQLLYQHFKVAPTPPSQLVEGVVPELDALILQLLAKQPQERLGHASDVAAALDRLGAQDGQADPGPKPRAYLYRPGFTGREEPLRELGELVSRLRKGAGGLVLIGGESGVGKTRLAMELTREARQLKLDVLTGECLPAAAGGEPRAASSTTAAGSQLAARGAQLAGAPLHPLRSALQQIADRCREKGLEEAQRLLGPRGKLLGMYEPSLLDLPGLEACPEPAELPAEAALLRLYDSLAETFAALTANRPLLLVLDDLQWADDLTISALEFFVRTGRLERMRLLVVGTYRTEEVGAMRASALQRLLETSGVARIVLRCLGQESVGSIVADMLARTPPPPLFVGYLHRHSEGNPFFVAEYLRAAVGAELLYRDEAGRWRVAAQSEAQESESLYEALPLPRTVRELVGRRLDGLEPGAGRLVEAAAVLGRESDGALLGAVAPLDGGELLEGIRQLLARQVLEELGAERFRFVHDKIREAAYERLSAARRSSLHLAAAQALEARAAEAQDERMAALGHHWEHAGRSEKARKCYLAAARRAVSRYGRAEAERLYLAYLRLTEEPTPESIEAQNELGEDVLEVQGRSGEALEVTHGSLRDARRIGDRRGEATSLRNLGYLHWKTGRIEEARALYEQALGIARELGDRTLQGLNLNSLAILRIRQGLTAEAGELYEQTLAIAREVGHKSLQGNTLGNLATLQMEQGRVAEAQALYQEALALKHEVGDRLSEGQTLANLAILYRDQGRMAEARALYDQALAIAREVGHRRGEGIALGNLAIVERDQGRMEEARALYRQAVAIAREGGDRRFEGLWHLQSSILERLDGRLADAERLLAVAEALLLEVGDRNYLAIANCGRGHLCLAEGRSGRRVLEQAEAAASELRSGPASELGEAVSRLRRAVEAFEAGRPLYRGECLEDLPEGVRRGLVV